MFRITGQCAGARAGMLHTAHARIETPFFMPVVTKGAAKFADFFSLEKAGTKCIISNSWLLYQKPGLGLIRKAGGLHSYYSWRRGIFTDSGGFQSVGSFFRQGATGEGMLLKSPYDGRVELITPEKSMEIQLALGSDVAMCLDDVPGAGESAASAKEKTERTHRWAEQCKRYHDRHKKSQLLFGIAQGQKSIAERKKSMRHISSLGFDGTAIGGLAIGEPTGTMHRLIEATANLAPRDKPRYLMGVGSPPDILKCVCMGIDCFDSTFPTQNARHATLFTWNGPLRILHRAHSRDLSCIDSRCGCIVCRRYSRAYIHHLMKLDEPTGKMLCTMHNLAWMQGFMRIIRKRILEGTIRSLCRNFWKEQI